MEKRIPIPKIASPYRRIYTPKTDIYKGIDTASFKNGQTYEDWIANDFTFIKDNNETWHAFGITHPKPPGFTDDFNYEGDVHEAEYQLFHCVYDDTLDSLCGGAMTEQEKVLYPQQRQVNEQPECWAPCAVERNGLYYLFYTPQSVRYAVSEDLYNWSPQGVLFKGLSHMRDPYIFFEDGVYTMVYIEDGLLYRTSEDLIHWSDAKVFQENPFSSWAAQESPCVWKRGGIYYLMWCIHDGQNGCYDNRSFVFASKDLYGFSGKTPIAMLPGHAPEIMHENGVDYTALCAMFSDISIPKPLTGFFAFKRFKSEPLPQATSKMLELTLYSIFSANRSWNSRVNLPSGEFS